MGYDKCCESVGYPKMTQKQAKWAIKREQRQARSQLKVIKKDFLDELPQQLRDIMYDILWRWKEYDWFEDAWNQYRYHVLGCIEKGTKIKAPGFIFNKYIDDQVEEDFIERENLDLLHCDTDLNELFHFGIKGQKWGMRRYQNADGTLTEAGKIRYLKGYKAGDPESEKKAVFDVDKWNKDSENFDQKEVKLVKETGSMSSQAAAAISTEKGSKVINNKDYSGIPDDEMRKRINRLSMEKQYGDLTGDNKYVMTGKEKAKEVLQTIGAVLGIAASAITVGMLWKELKGTNVPNKVKD